MCVHRQRQERCKAGIFDKLKLIRKLLLMIISECLFVLNIYIYKKLIAVILKQCLHR